VHGGDGTAQRHAHRQVGTAAVSRRRRLTQWGMAATGLAVASARRRVEDLGEEGGGGAVAAMWASKATGEGLS
jgi:hypothetical protein